jgi:hypothetical protein
VKPRNKQDSPFKRGILNMSLNDDEEVDVGNYSVGSIENKSLNGKMRQSVP